MSAIEDFNDEVSANIAGFASDPKMRELTHAWISAAGEHNWAYNFSWFGRPAIQFPTDAWAIQEIIWETTPDLIIETGIAHGGSILYYASLLALLDMIDYMATKTTEPFTPKRRVIGIDIDIRSHNRAAIDAHPLRPWLFLIEGSSIDPEVVQQVKIAAERFPKRMVALDSNHTHEHVYLELLNYAPMVTSGQYCVIFDTLVEDIPGPSTLHRPWGKGNNPKTAVWEFLKSHTEFQINSRIQDKLQITTAPDGFLRRI